MRRLGILLSLLVLVTSVYSQNRIALVIGNGDYTVLPKLATAVTDAQNVAQALRRLGFKVALLTNAGLKDMDKAFEDLRTSLSQSPKSYGFFFYSGHAVRDQGLNYLIPADADIGAEPLLKAKALPLQGVLDSVDVAGNPLNVIVLDACHDNPFPWAASSVKGLAEVARQPRGSVVAFSAKPNTAAPDRAESSRSFATELQSNLAIPGLEIREVFDNTAQDVRTATDGRQSPSVAYLLPQKFYLAGTGHGDTPVGLLPPQQVSSLGLGTIGPGGGLIFFNKGNAEGGWQYLEAAQEDLPAAAWFNGKDGVLTGAAQTSLGSGKDNTAKILAALGPGNYAAAFCAAYPGGGLRDWFLPSKDELDALLKFLKLQQTFGSLADFYYWSSTERGPTEAWLQEFHKGKQGYNLKGFRHLVRPIRSF